MRSARMLLITLLALGLAGSAVAWPDEGNTCHDPILISLSLTTISTGNCGRGNDFWDTGLDFDSQGEDIFFQLNLTGEAAIWISVESVSKQQNQMLLAVYGQCPLEPGSYIAHTIMDDTETELYIANLTLAAGSYYIVVDTLLENSCIDMFDLTVHGGPVANQESTWSSVKAIFQ